mmetsp:Transcript_28580/g.71089  ORF Transcript_28580/g.71089 Transcript_28580/m.71089 type:complete len:203 (+) Transcript_28580:2667-3275(+)
MLAAEVRASGACGWLRLLLAGGRVVIHRVGHADETCERVERVHQLLLVAADEGLRALVHLAHVVDQHAHLLLVQIGHRDDGEAFHRDDAHRVVSVVEQLQQKLVAALVVEAVGHLERLLLAAVDSDVLPRQPGLDVRLPLARAAGVRRDHAHERLDHQHHVGVRHLRGRGDQRRLRRRLLARRGVEADAGGARVDASEGGRL